MRNEKIDVLRAFGLFMVILAHVSPPDIIFQLRNFDVPLMVLIGGLSFSISYKNIPYLQYIRDRFIRLVFPVWIFLTIFFGSMFFLNLPMPDTRKIIGSYLLLSGIGYVWIVRVFLLVAIVAPLLSFFNKKCKSDIIFFAILIVLYFSYEFLVLYRESFGHSSLYVLDNVVFYCVPYAVVFSIGMRIIYYDNRKIGVLAAIFFAAFIFLAYNNYKIKNEFVYTQLFKYPPTIYYFSYALMVGMLLWYFSDKLVRLLDFFGLKRLVLFYGKNSIWIYLWHIMFLEFIDGFWLIRYLCVLFLSSVVVFMQSVIFVGYVSGKVRDKSMGRFIRLVLTG